MKITDVYIVADLSESMWPHKDAIQRDMVWDTIKALADEEKGGNQAFNVTLIGFWDSVARSGKKSASGWVRADVDRELGNRHGNTALMDAIGLAFDRIEVNEAPTPEAILITVFSDGEENHSRYWGRSRIAAKLKLLEMAGNLTVTFAGPASARGQLTGIGIPEGNFRAWDGSISELKETRAQVASSVTTYITDRKAGLTRSSRFYVEPTKLTTPGVRANTQEVRPTDVRTVTRHMDGRAIADFFGSRFRAGSHYYQLVKPEYIQDDKDLVIRIKGARQDEYRRGSLAVRSLLGLPPTGKIRVHPGAHSTQYDIFVQSASVNRKVVEGQQLLTL